MRYAVISDVHGNLPALEAVITDAEQMGADAYLALGDYIVDYPWPNEVAEFLKSLPNATIIAGNKEQRFNDSEKYAGVDQMAAAYWTYRNLTPENLAYYMSLPVITELTLDSGEVLRLEHNPAMLYRKERIQMLNSSYYAIEMKERPFNPNDYSEIARNEVSARADALADIAELRCGVYLWGHNHLQSYFEIDGKLFINPGSCGQPMDVGGTAPYILLERTSEGWSVTERRARYDVKATVDALMSSELAAAAPFWSKLTAQALLTGRDCIAPFLRFLFEFGKSRGEVEPFGNEIFQLAVEAYESL